MAPTSANHAAGGVHAASPRPVTMGRRSIPPGLRQRPDPVASWGVHALSCQGAAAGPVQDPPSPVARPASGPPEQKTPTASTIKEATRSPSQDIRSSPLVTALLRAPHASGAERPGAPGQGHHHDESPPPPHRPRHRWPRGLGHGRPCCGPCCAGAPHCPAPRVSMLEPARRPTLTDSPGPGTGLKPQGESGEGHRDMLIPGKTPLTGLSRSGMGGR